MVDAVHLYRAAATAVYASGVSVIAAYADTLGGLITNPEDPEGQGIDEVEILWYSYNGPAATFETATTFPLQPGQSLKIPSIAVPLWVNSKTSGHKFSGVVFQVPPIYPPIPVPGDFPPAAPQSMAKIIPQYLYEQYQNDDDLQAFVRAYNEFMQVYLTWFNTIGLPIYTGPNINGELLDWVARGLYGLNRPTLSSGRNQDLGPYNTAMFNQIAYNDSRKIGPNDVTVTTDDVFKRIMTWRLYRGDGKVFNAIWLKRRIMRFLFGPNGTDPGVTNTYPVSVTFASSTEIDIILPANPMSKTLKEAIDTGAVELPFQYTYSVTIAA